MEKVESTNGCVQGRGGDEPRPKGMSALKGIDEEHGAGQREEEKPGGRGCDPNTGERSKGAEVAHVRTEAEAQLQLVDADQQP